MILLVIAWLSLGVMILGISIFVHELAHRKMAWHLGYSSEFIGFKKVGRRGFAFFTGWDDNNNNEKHEYKILLAGVVAGLLPILTSFMFIQYGIPPVLCLWLIVAYVWFSWADMRRIAEISPDEE